MSLIKRGRESTSLLTLIPYLKRYRKRLLLGTLAILLTNLAAVTSPWILRVAIDKLETQVLDARMISFYAGLIILVSLVEGGFRFLMRRIMIGVSRLVEYDLRNDLFSNLQTLSARFYQHNSTGDIMARATNDLSAVRAVLGPGIMYSINTFFTALFTITVLLSISPRLALLTLLPLAFVSPIVKYFGRLIHQRFEGIQRQFSRITTLAQENVAGIRVVKAYDQEQGFIKRFREVNEAYMERSLSLVRIWGVFQPLLTLLLGLSLVALLWYGGLQVIEGRITIGDFVAFLAYLSMLTWPTIALGYVINIFERGSASMSRINRFLFAKADVADDSPERIDRLTGDIAIRNLSFSYNGRPVLSDVSVTVKPGSTLAIVGRTGSGKSTLANLLCRLYPVEDGCIFIDGYDINRIPLRTLRTSVGFAPQDTFLFSDTIGRNIAFGNPEAPPSEIESVAAVSNLLPDILEFPERFDTFVGERGITLSGGQKQRAAISRALLVDPSILILDDSLSAVDTETEERILQQLAKVRKGRTSIVISHRISTVKTADQILVLDRGRVIEVGTHNDLLAQEGSYADLYQRQLLKEELEIE